MSLKALGSDCSTAVVHTPRNYEVMSSLLFLSLTLSLSGASLIGSLEEVHFSGKNGCLAVKLGVKQA